MKSVLMESTIGGEVSYDLNPLHLTARAVLRLPGAWVY